jgi:predicted amidohydrolase
MSFREKTAWITLVTILVCFGAYYGAIISGMIRQTSWQAFHFGIMSIVGLVLLQAALNFAAMLVTPRDSRNARDERELMIHARSHVIGYYVLMIGMAGTLILTHLPVAGESLVDLIVRIVNVGIAAMVCAALSVAIAQIVMLRRGY